MGRTAVPEPSVMALLEGEGHLGKLGTPTSERFLTLSKTRGHFLGYLCAYPCPGYRGKGSERESPGPCSPEVICGVTHLSPGGV